ncbi:phosphoesterase [Treponema saccharophilum]|nr:phosphoesterase [Treponema saccharophilum]
MKRKANEQHFFIADTHFGDERILRYENRPFLSVDKMNSEIIKRWNERGKKFLVKGNHDTKSNEHYRRAGFCEVYDLPVIFQNFWLLSHEPLYVCQNMPYANIFGHVHANPIYKDFSEQSFCVSVERINYTPVSFDEIKRVIAEEKTK